MVGRLNLVSKAQHLKITHCLAVLEKKNLTCVVSNCLYLAVLGSWVQHTGSFVAARRFSSCVRGLRSWGEQACLLSGTWDPSSPNQGLNLCTLHCKVDS